MKLVNRKTRKKIEKTVRKAMKKHGDAIVASIASGLASSVATLAKTESPRKPGKSNLTDMTERAKKSLSKKGQGVRRAALGKKSPVGDEQTVN